MTPPSTFSPHLLLTRIHHPAAFSSTCAPPLSDLGQGLRLWPPLHRCRQALPHLPNGLPPRRLLVDDNGGLLRRHILRRALARRPYATSPITTSSPSPTRPSQTPQATRHTSSAAHRTASLLDDRRHRRGPRGLDGDHGVLPHTAGAPARDVPELLLLEIGQPKRRGLFRQGARPRGPVRTRGDHRPGGRDAHRGLLPRARTHRRGDDPRGARGRGAAAHGDLHAQPARGGLRRGGGS